MKGRGLAVGLGLAGVVCAASDLACSSSSGAPAQGNSAATSAYGDPITIGVSNSLTGGLKGIGTPLQNAVRVAEQYVNSSGGVLGRKLRFVIEDDQSDEGATAQATMKSLLSQGAVAVIGPNGSGQVAAVQDLPFKAKILELSATATSPTLSAAQPMHDRYFFRTVPPDDLQGKAVVRLAILGPAGLSADGGAGVACKKMALFYYTNPYGTAMAQVIKDNFPSKSGGGTIVADVMVGTDVKSDYNTEVTTIVNAKPDCMSTIVYDDVGDAFMTAFHAALMTPPVGWNPAFFVIGTDGVYTQDYITNGRINRADPNSMTVVENVYGTNPDTNPPGPNYNDFANLYKAQFPLPAGQDDVDAYAANEFDAAILIALAIEQAGTASDSTKIRDALYAVSRKTNRPFGPGELVSALEAIRKGTPIHYAGASGDLEFDDAGNVVAGYIIWHVKMGKFETLAHVKASDL
jgi:branched-chain amino acid transport system substrate-binding protein